MTAIEILLAGLFDYAGLYPPASLAMRAAVENYGKYRRDVHAWALGRLIVNLDRIGELRAVAGSSLDGLRISVIASERSDWEMLAELVRSGIPIETVEIKCVVEDVERIAAQIPMHPPAFFEVSLGESECGALRSIAASGAHAKVRMGGLVPEAIPLIKDVARTLVKLAELKIPFKATAGLHHPVRSQRPLTYQPQSPTGTMHGFLNLSCASALAYFGGSELDVAAALNEPESTGFKVTPNAIQWRDRSWTAEQLTQVRRHFLMSIGSCSFEEPIRDLESMGWL